MKTNIREILPIQSVSYNDKEMFEYLCKKLTSMNIEYYTLNGNIYATKNPQSLPLIPAFVSHIDTVHKITDEIHILEFNDGDILTGFNRVKMTQTGIGGDDKVGIYYCLRALEELDAVKVAFFKDEEVGCHGSSDADMSFFSDVSMIFQGDRKGNKDFVTNISGIPLSTEAFQKDIADVLKVHNYEFQPNGGITDVGQLRENGLTVPVANISCGYYNPHMSNEYIVMSDVENGLSMLLEISRLLGSAEYYIEPYSYTQTWDEDLSWGFVHIAEIDEYVPKEMAYYDFDSRRYKLIDENPEDEMYLYISYKGDFEEIIKVKRNISIDYALEEAVELKIISLSDFMDIEEVEEVTFREYLEYNGY